MVNCCLIYKLNFVVVIPENPLTWAKDLMGIIAYDIIYNTTEAAEVISLDNPANEIPPFSEADPSGCATVQIYAELPDITFPPKNFTREACSRLLKGDGVVDCVQSIGSGNPVITLVLPSLNL